VKLSQGILRLDSPCDFEYSSVTLAAKFTPSGCSISEVRVGNKLMNNLMRLWLECRFIRVRLAKHDDDDDE
jgi:hypothetical protein